jgi:hypothetical protein
MRSSARGFFRWEDDVARLGASAPLSSDVGSFRARVFGLALEWSADVWHPAAAPEEGGEVPQD